MPDTSTGQIGALAGGKRANDFDIWLPGLHLGGDAGNNGSGLGKVRRHPKQAQNAKTLSASSKKI